MIKDAAPEKLGEVEPSFSAIREAFSFSLCLSICLPGIGDDF